MTTLPPAFKSLLSAFKRADELDRDTQRENRIVAYHIRYWGVTKAAKLMSKDPEEQKFIASQLDLLEKISPQLHIGEGEGKTTCIQQATLLFDRADEIDRAGFADKATAKLFYTAATIYDSLEQFGEQDNEVRHSHMIHNVTLFILSLIFGNNRLLKERNMLNGRQQILLILLMLD